MARRFKGKRRGRRAVVPLPDTAAATPVEAAAPGAGGQGPWFVIIMTDEERRRLYTVMTRDVAPRVHHAATPLLSGYTQEHGIERLVHVERYLCRHTAYARMMRIRNWPVAARRKLVEADNPEWENLAEAA